MHSNVIFFHNTSKPRMIMNSLTLQFQSKLSIEKVLHVQQHSKVIWPKPDRLDHAVHDCKHCTCMHACTCNRAYRNYGMLFCSASPPNITYMYMYMCNLIYSTCTCIYIVHTMQFIFVSVVCLCYPFSLCSSV